MERTPGSDHPLHPRGAASVEAPHRSSRRGLWTVIAIIGFGLIFLCGLIAALVTVGHHGRIEPGP